ncbi:29930_t:CDS:2 [Gigaspora margarita]|uniref:29930_t:CDS:1 n=1 Tax=Gigaspora margarita TaxID=4874 RepID=A0ABN7UP75_GIGMA|nr:29930_t:CDS:2 [Gigaspora margarita]
MECKTTKSQQFHSLAGKKWKEAEAATKWVKVSIEDKIKESVELRDIEITIGEDIEAVDKEVSIINLVEVVRSMARIFYEREHTQKEGPIYLFDKMRELLSQIDPSLKKFFNQLYSLAQPFEHCKQTMGHSVGTSNEGLNTLANISITTTARAVDYKKKQISENHRKYIKKSLKNFRELVFDKYSLFFNDIYKGIFGENKVLIDFVYLKFGNGCKNIEFLYLTDLLSNLIPLVLDIYVVHHREDNWLAYEEAYNVKIATGDTTIEELEFAKKSFLEL